MSSVKSKAAKLSARPSATPKCDCCNKSVFKLEEFRVDGSLLHKSCFKCAECKRKLGLDDFASVNKKFYCKTHYLYLFSSSGGSYEVFGDAGFRKSSTAKLRKSEAESVKTEEETAECSKVSVQPIRSKTEVQNSEPKLSESATNHEVQNCSKNDESEKQENCGELANESQLLQRLKLYQNRAAGENKDEGKKNKFVSEKSSNSKTKSISFDKKTKQLCDFCNKTVFKLEEFKVDGAVFHRQCFKCTMCKGKLTIGSFASVNRKFYCKPHYHELFAKSGGSYDAFGDSGFKKQTSRQKKVLPRPAENTKAAGMKEPERTNKVVETAYTATTGGSSLKDKLKKYQAAAGM